MSNQTTEQCLCGHPPEKHVRTKGRHPSLPGNRAQCRWYFGRGNGRCRCGWYRPKPEESPGAGTG